MFVKFYLNLVQGNLLDGFFCDLVDVTKSGCGLGGGRGGVTGRMALNLTSPAGRGEPYITVNNELGNSPVLLQSAHSCVHHWNSRIHIVHSNIRACVPINSSCSVNSSQVRLSFHGFIFRIFNFLDPFFSLSFILFFSISFVFVIGCLSRHLMCMIVCSSLQRAHWVCEAGSLVFL